MIETIEPRPSSVAPDHSIQVFVRARNTSPCAGSKRWQGHALFPKTMAGLLRHLWCYFDDQTCRLERIQNPFGPKVPMSPE